MSPTALRSTMFYLFAAAMFALALVSYGSIPFVGMPTLGQALGTTAGFAKSIANHGLFEIYARDFGYPEPAPRSFGLAGVLVTAMLLRLGINAGDAYTIMTVLFLLVAFVGAYRLCIHHRCPRAIALVLATTWLVFPVVRQHAGYSMLSLGFALLPAYIYAVELFIQEKNSLIVRFVTIFAVSIISVFMDGYTFVIYAYSALAYLTYKSLLAFDIKKYRKFIIEYVLFGLSLAMAYFLYRSYIGVSSFKGSGIDFHRGWGADASFLIVPPAGVFYLWDTLGLGTIRTGRAFWGDSSVWQTTFLLPLLLSVVAIAILSRFANARALIIVLAAAGAIYLSLGPSLKVFLYKPADAVGETAMPAARAGISTGSAILYENVPGIKDMRASYRWIGGAFLLFWLVLVISVGSAKVSTISVYAIVCLLLIASLPHIDRKIARSIETRNAYALMQTELIPDFRNGVMAGELALFVPPRNDLLVNYLAPSVGFKAYNIGGDKNMELAREYWPPNVRNFRRWSFDQNLIQNIVAVLMSQEADVVLLPYVDTLHAVARWPSPPVFKDTLAPTVEELSTLPFLSVEEHVYYAAVRLDSEAKLQLGLDELRTRFYTQVCMPPSCFEMADYQVAHQVGDLQDGTLVSDGRAGFLHFGPYAAFERGSYTLTLAGLIETPAGAWIDVVSRKGTQEHARFELSASTTAEREVVLVENLTLDQDVADLEIRVWISADTVMRLEGYELRKVGPRN